MYKTHVVLIDPTMFVGYITEDNIIVANLLVVYGMGGCIVSIDLNSHRSITEVNDIALFILTDILRGDQSIRSVSVDIK